MKNRASLIYVIAVTPSLAFAAPEIVASDKGAVMERIGDGVYAIIHDDATDEWPHGNTGVVVFDNGVLVIDSAYLPSRARKDIALIRTVTKNPVRYLTTTHWHFDHNNGASAYRQAFPDLVVIHEEETDRYIELNSTYWPHLSTAEGSARLKAIEALETEFKTGKSADGVGITEERKAALKEAIAQRRAETGELRSLDVVQADVLFEDRVDLRLGGKRVEFFDRGRANSPNDMTVFLPDQKILFTGDIVVQSPLPYVGGSWPKDWVGVLADLEATKASIIVPGHGPVMSDFSYAQRLRETFRTVLDRVEALVRKGRTLDQTKAEIELDDLRGTDRLWIDGVSDSDWQLTKDTLVERAYRNIRGQG